MSQTEYHYGKLRKLELDDDEISNFFEQKCIAEGRDKLPYEGWFETYNYYISSEKYYKVNGFVYEIVEHEEIDDYYMSKLIPHEDGTYTFVMSFYNGGTCLSECIQDAIKDLK